MTDPEDVSTYLPTRDLEEVAVDETPDSERGLPLEADPADVEAQRYEVPVDDDEDL